MILDLAFLSGQQNFSQTITVRKYELHIFKKIKAKIASPFLLKILFDKSFHFRVWRRLFKNVKIFQQSGCGFAPSFLEAKPPVYLDGFFQSEKYFEHIRIELLHEFSFPALDKDNLDQLQNIRAQSNAVSLHIRRGDYLKPHILQQHGILPLSYYKKAIEILQGVIGRAYYFIFSDDAEWCKNNFSFLEGQYTTVHGNEGTYAWKDMCLMSNCKHHIIANSSFSWWGAWLNPSPDKVVVAPKQWFADEERNKESVTIIPEKWIRL